MDYKAVFSKLSVSSRGLARYQRIANVLKLFNGYSPFPLHIDLFLTFRCNFACAMCNLRQEENVKSISPFRRPELSPIEWKQVIDNIRRSFCFRPNLNLLGGEPSVYKGYLDVAAYAKKQGFRCAFTTNGAFLQRDAAEIVASGVDTVVVSIDGPQEIHDHIRMPGAYEKAIKGIQMINELKDEQTAQTPQLFLACVVSGDNYGYLANLIDIARDLGIGYITFLHLQFHDHEIATHGIDVDALTKEMARVKNKAEEQNISVNFYPYLKKDRLTTYYLQTSDHFGKGCISPWLRVMIMPDGSIISCRGYVVGNVRTDKTSLRSVWNNKEFRLFRQSLAKQGIFPDCGRCCRREY